jgi:hypothetical protein
MTMYINTIRSANDPTFRTRRCSDEGSRLVLLQLQLHPFGGYKKNRSLLNLDERTNFPLGRSRRWCFHCLD